jgi:hypothetical protein
MPTFSSAKKLTLPIALALGLAACGSGSPSVAHLNSAANSHHPSSSSSGAGLNTSSGSGSGGASATIVPGGGGAAKALKFSECMRSHGVPNFPDPSASGSISINSSSGINPQSKQVQDAQNTCGKLLSLGNQAPSPAQRAQALANALKFSQCMRSHGVTNFPDPQSSGGGAHITLKVNATGGLNPSSPIFQAAQKACQGNIPPLSAGTPRKAS